MPFYADIVFPTAVRQPFTYSLPDERVRAEVEVGKRVWVPLQKHKAIGVVVRIHEQTPDFNTRAVEEVLDEEAVLSGELLKLTRWMYRFYYCGWGETIQAALPAGLSFQAEKRLRAVVQSIPEHLDEQKANIVEEVQAAGSYSLKEANKRWNDKIIQQLVGQKLLEIWEEPSMKMAPSTENLWDWKKESSCREAQQLVKAYEEEGKNYKWVRALNVLSGLDLPAFQRELTPHDLLEHYTLNRIAEEGLLRVREVESNNLSLKHDHDPSQLKTLNEEQQTAYEQLEVALETGGFASFLLYGVTGSGKTEVYIHALKKALSQGRGGLVLVPEIGLTPQIVKRFYTIFGDDIAVLHSRLTNRERYDAWRALQQGEKRIAIGARSAVFAPVQDLGLLVVDEEHDASYKQKDPAPRYHGRDVAIMRAHINDAVVVTGSATPSMVTLQAAKKGKSKLLTLNERPFEATLPDVDVLDLKQYRSAMRGPLAVPLFNAVEEALERGEQAILLYNRRGFSFYLQCEHCGEIPECPNCSVSLTFHKSKKQLRCHYCGYAERQPRQCRECGHEAVNPQGSGTQRLEEQVGTLFPEAKTLRMDFDTTSGKNAHANILKAFERKEADILVGTQIVGKGLDFPDVTVVGVIDADTELAFPSFRSGERMFQLLSQVAGRSGRAGKEGRVFFQTWQPDHPAMVAAQKHQFREFARQELAQRKALQYPPFSRLIRFVFKGKREGRVRSVALAFTESLARTIGSEDPVLGPSPAPIARMQNYYRWESFIKIKPTNGAGAIEQLIDRTFDRYEKDKPKGASSVRINVNVDALE
ncbi:replication restart helicase PriA [Fodinibius sediminis]|uniref:Replication restart protein PriA n=1 Tax=Fodinibius sediminis TaxID=1214077 RepID=A0A521ANA5_9BACT|nr:primosomal protein N' [Fodinibius sediminis]SMO36293.1 replication restart DNA helicase PriA [Fodinibius sediminis]